MELFRQFRVSVQARRFCEKSRGHALGIALVPGKLEGQSNLLMSHLGIPRNSSYFGYCPAG